MSSREAARRQPALYVLPAPSSSCSPHTLVPARVYSDWAAAPCRLRVVLSDQTHDPFLPDSLRPSLAGSGGCDQSFLHPCSARVKLCKDMQLISQKLLILPEVRGHLDAGQVPWASNIYTDSIYMESSTLRYTCLLLFF